MKEKLAAVLLISYFLISCGKKEDVVEIHLWHFGGTTNMMEWVRARVDSFNNTHPGIRVVQSQKSWGMIRELLYTNFVSGTGPDVLNVHANHAAEFGEAGFFHPINQFPDFAEVRSWYEPNLFASTRYRDNYYGLPASALAFVLVCNKEMFDAEGVAPPKTWSEFREAARRLTKDADGDGSIDQWGLVLFGGDRGGFSYRLAPFLYKAGVDILSDDLTKAEFNSPMGVAAVKLFADMHQIDRSITPGFLAYTLSEINDLFCSNKAAMSIEGPWFRDMVDEKSPGKEFYTVPVPVPDAMLDRYSSSPTLQDMVMYAINVRSTHLDESWQLTKYLCNEEADRELITSELGGIPTTVKVLSGLDADKKKDLSLYRNELLHARPWPPHPAIINIAKNAIAPWSQKAIIGELSAQAAMDEAAKEAQMILEGRK
ncbi:MAG: sugar ABC transporter substrate-binding protein [Bacteroidota bacterium]